MIQGRRVRTRWTIAVAMLLSVHATCAAPSSAWAGEREGDALRAGMADFFGGIADRYPGSPGNLEAEARVARVFASSGLENGEIRFRTPCFLPGETRVALADGTTFDLRPMHPGLFRPGNFLENEFEMDIVYVAPPERGAGGLSRDTQDAFADAAGLDLDGALVLQEFSGGWSSYVGLGARGFIFIGDGDYARHDCNSKLSLSEARVPRFFIAPEPGQALKAGVREAGGRLTVRVRAEPSRWENRLLRNLWAFVPGRDPTLQREVILITAPIDANCIVPTLAAGATPAANLHLMLKLFDDYRQAPPDRSVMFVAVNARTQAYRGDRQLAWHLLAPPRLVENVRDVLAADMRRQQLFTSYYTNLTLHADTLERDARFIDNLRTLTDNSLGPNLTIKNPVVTAVKKDVNRLRGRQILIERAALPEDPAARRGEVERRELERRELEAERQKYVRVLALFNRRPSPEATLPRLYEESPESIPVLRGYVDDILRNNRRWAALNAEDLVRDQANSDCRRVLAGRRIRFALSLEFDWQSPRLGFFTGDDGGWGSLNNWASRFGHNSQAVAQSLPRIAAGEAANPLVDTLTLRGGIEEGYYTPGFMGGGASAFYRCAESTPAFALRNVFASYPRAFSPADTLDNLDATACASVFAFLPDYLRALLAHREITSPSELPLVGHASVRATSLWSGRIATYEFDDYTADVVPTVPVPNTMVINRERFSNQGVDPMGVVSYAMGLTDERAQIMVYGHYWKLNAGSLLCDAFAYDKDFKHIRYAVDAGDIHERVKSTIVTQSDPRKTLALFRCREFPIFDRIDSSLVSAFPIRVDQYIILSATRESTPRKYGFYGGASLLSAKPEPVFSAGPFMVFAEPDEPIKVLTRRKRVILNASDAHPEGIGYMTADELGAGFFDAAARDMTVLNRHRLGEMTGVSDELANEFLKRGNAALRTMDAALTRRDYLAYARARFIALGAQVKAYNQTTSITNDMLKAVVFYMALLLPFSFFLQKLLFKAVRVEIQMALFALIFVLTFIVFRLIHPAFRISESPEAMFVSFVMGGLAFFVIRVLQGRFDGEMQLLFQTYTGMDTAEVAYSTAGQQAMLIGVQNMKRRRVRTALTTATIVLVTFTMLAFSSISKRMSPTVIPKGKGAPYTGLMYHWPGQTMDAATAGVINRMFRDKADLLWRMWILSPRLASQTQARRMPMHIRSLPQRESANIEAILGLSVMEDGFLERIPLKPGGRFFSSDDADEVIVTPGVADKLGVGPEDIGHSTVEFIGRRYTIVGILDAGRFSAIRDIDGRSLVPIQVTRVQRGQEETVAMTAEEESDAGVEYVNTALLILMPLETVDRVQGIGATPYSVSIRFPDDEPVWPHVETLLTATDAKFYVSSRVPFQAGGEAGRRLDAGLYYMGSGYRTSIGGLSVLIIPLLIASTIILNTMLGAVYERKAEIAVYNAVGLNPNHIGMFFMAEAFVYSVIGSVGGYLIGQVLTLVLTKFNLVSNLNLNFSSLNVVYVILFTVAVVMLSTLYPAHVATKTAIPSGKRKWSLPPHDGVRMEIAFPFIYREHLLPGIMNYLQQYFARFTEASIGDLVAEPLDTNHGHDADGRPTYAIAYRVALAPFDLGVTQRVAFAARYDEKVRSHRVFMTITRLSGQDTNWTFTNRPFLERLRQHMMHWRNLSEEQHAEFVRQGRSTFGEA